MSIYPDNWAVLAHSIKEACGWSCMACGKQCRRPGEMYLGWNYVLTVAHITQDYAAAEVQVAVLCSGCHLRHDAPFSWWGRRRRQRLRRQMAGQLVFSLRL